MNLIKLAVGGAAAAAVLFAASGVASAAVPNNGPGLSATTRVSDRSDGASDGHTWARDTFPRQIKLINEGDASASHCGGNLPCTEYSYTIWDGGHGLSNGGWVATGGLAPNQTTFPGSHLAPGTFGSFVGTQQGVFYTDELSSPSGINVPSELSGDSPSSSAWPALFWPYGTSHLSRFFGLGADSFSYTYTSTIFHQTWVDSDLTGDGGAPFAGNITR